MSRIGKLPIDIPQGVTVTVNPDNTVVVKGPKGELSQDVHGDMIVKVEGAHVIVERPSEDKAHKAMHGLYRGQVLELGLGYSHGIFMVLPNEVKVSVLNEKRANPIITLESCDKQLIGQVAAKIRSFRKPEPYKGKGIKFVGEVLRRKAGKSAKV